MPWLLAIKHGILAPFEVSPTDSITSQLVNIFLRISEERSLFILNLGSNDCNYAFLNGKSIGQVEVCTPIIKIVIRNQERESVHWSNYTQL